MNLHRNARGGKTNYNWHPQVHAHLGENLWFFLIRFKDPTSAAVEDQMQRLLTETGVKHACEYTLYGYWDGLIRVWMTDTLKRRFVRVLKSKADALGVEELRSFEVGALYYLWHDPALDLLDSGPALADTNSFKDQIQAAEGDADKLEDPHALLGNSLLIERPDWPSGGVKIYMSLDYTAPSPYAQEYEVPRILRAIEAAELEKRASLYVGAGFSRYLLRCAVNDFNSILGLTENFYQQLSELHRTGLALRPNTFVIIEASMESDNFNYFGSLSAADELTAERLDLDLLGRQRLAEMSQDERTHIHDLVVRADTLAREDEQLNGKLTALIRACIEEDLDEVRNALLFVIDFEWEFREYMIPIWAGHYSGDWRKQLVGRAESAEPGKNWESQLEISPSEWTFGALHKLAAVSGRDAPVIQEKLEEDLGEKWHGEIQALVTLRNYAAHSKAKTEKRLSDLSGSWGRRVEEFINSAEMYRRLTHLNRARRNGDDAG
ncbi:MAG TPA: hypothetical protein VFP17_07865 [Solirubrobacterales bacterium]|nr:hypothetical protein [Solirubrobacterales bacterium]